MKLLIAGGGTGGHLFPGIAVAQEFLSRNKENHVLFIGTQKGIECTVLPKFNLPLKTVWIQGYKGKSALAKIFTLFMIPISTLQALIILLQFKPDVVLGVGGYASFPAILAAWVLRKKRFIQEQNVTLGMTNRILSYFVHKVFLRFESPKKYISEKKAIVTGNPVRKFVSKTIKTSDRFILFILGGSQGAHSINRAMLEALPFLTPLKEKIHLIHQTGRADLRWVENVYTENHWQVEIYDFIYNMDEVIDRADYIICRAGASTVSELTVKGKACLFIPYPHASHHQEKNARALADDSAARLLLDWKLNGQTLAKEIEWALQNPRALEVMRKKMLEHAHPYAATAIVDELLSI